MHTITVDTSTLTPEQIAAIEALGINVPTAGVPDRTLTKDERTAFNSALYKRAKVTLGKGNKRLSGALALAREHGVEVPGFPTTMAVAVPANAPAKGALRETIKNYTPVKRDHVWVNADGERKLVSKKQFDNNIRFTGRKPKGARKATKNDLAELA